MAWLAAFSAAVLSIWALVSKIRNSGKAEVEVKLRDVQHEQEQNERINKAKQDIEKVIEDIEAIRQNLTDTDGKIDKRFTEIEKDIKDLRSELLRLVIGLKDRL